MTLKELCGVLHDLPVWVNAENGSERYENGCWQVPGTDNLVSYITVDGNGELTVQVYGDLYGGANSDK